MQGQERGFVNVVAAAGLHIQLLLAFGASKGAD